MDADTIQQQVESLQAGIVVRTRDASFAHAIVDTAKRVGIPAVATQELDGSWVIDSDHFYF